MEATLEKAILDDAERALADGLRLKRWWEQKEARQSYARSLKSLAWSKSALNVVVDVAVDLRARTPGTCKRVQESQLSEPRAK